MEASIQAREARDIAMTTTFAGEHRDRPFTPDGSFSLLRPAGSLTWLFTYLKLLLNYGSAAFVSFPASPSLSSILSSPPLFLRIEIAEKYLCKPSRGPRWPPNMADRGSLRVLRELKQLERSDQLAITVSYKERNIRDINALIIGPPGTPYAYGFYQVRSLNDALDATGQKDPTRLTGTCERGSSPSSFPMIEYPARPPKVSLRTTNKGLTRFGPNLYANGKVCLTWTGERGEEWSAAQGLESVLLSIQSLLATKPYFLEPGFEHDTNEKDVEIYSSKIRHENLRLAIIAPLEKAFGIEPVADPPSSRSESQSREESSENMILNHLGRANLEVDLFEDFCKQRLLWYMELYKDATQEGITKEGDRHLSRFPQMAFESRGNNMCGQWDYHTLKDRLDVLEKLIIEETDRWPMEGLQAAKDDAGIAVSLRAQLEQISAALAVRSEGTIEVKMVDENPFLWRLTYIGRPMTQFDGGILKVKIYISPRHPVQQPRVFLETPLYHVRVSTQNVLAYLPARAEEMSRHIDGIITSLEEEQPPFNPYMTVNPEATKLCWGSKDEQRLYARKLRRSVEKTME
ncbi:hypothetical protein N7462_000811 [Penicillium macrosclerotiorum]|uniref:uncharacterized protein n=1 Tax=Penicillium macrosclerotiorum TaxID=303699 RepID=UPI0025473D5F|nr:uncharacterized protein N7462_000811 [Penicillium macrosclerotiorum]KAJ5698806.1 hypothetical protein N7462_000811 [Penicillium macrosclerotiorum]